MRITLSRHWTVSLLAAAALLALAGMVSGALAQEPGGIAAAASTPSTETFTYQGYLEMGGAPANGAYDFRFSVYDDAAAGALIGSVETVDDQPVQDGVFTVYLTCGGPGAVFTGGPRWLQVEVRPGESADAYTTLPRQPITATPYAWSLRPHAQITGELPPGDLDGAVLGVELAGYFPIGMAVYGKTATGSAVRGDSTWGSALYGYTTTGYAVYGFSSATMAVMGRGYGGYFAATGGVGVYGHSSADRVWSNQYAPGVYGRSLKGVGVYGLSDSADYWMAGVRGESSAGEGVQGRSTSGNGVNGYSSTGVGVRAGSQDGTGLLATSWNGDLIRASQVVGLAEQLRFRVSGAGNVYADGSYSTPAADFAEMLPAADGAEPGDVLAVNEAGLLVPSGTPYDTAVLGVYSTRPGFVGGAPGGEAAAGTVPLAVVGVVPVKASAENGAILPGDLLVASATPGHAMRAGEDPPQGSVIGKALEPLASGVGQVRMLVTLQ